jgi:ferredoxin
MGKVQRLSPEPAGLVIDITAPGTWTRPDAEETVVIAVDVDGVRHATSLEQCQPRTPEVLGARPWRRSTKITILVDRRADDPVSRHLRGSTAIGDRVYLGRSPSMDLRPEVADSPVVGVDAVSNPAVRGGRDTTRADGFTVHFARSGVSVPAGSDGLLLDLAESAGLEPTTGCRRGVCHRCTTELLSGTSTNTRDGTVGHPGDSVRICVSTATTDLELNL